MKAVEANLLAFLKRSPQFIIPIYQRTYSWTENECAQLWSDILIAGQNSQVNAHFVGSVVYVEKGLYSVSSQSPLLVIDGQQRLTTVTLLIAALAEAVGEEVEPVEGFSARKLRNYYLLNPEEIGERYYKLLLSQTDKNTLLAIVGQKPQPKEHSIRVAENYSFFKKTLAQNIEELEAVCKGLAKLLIVDISLDRQYDNPQLIFESMNSTGRELTQADLIRNYILMGLEPDLQTQLYEHYWRPMELDFGQEAYQSHFDAFMRHYLTVKTREIPRLDRIYDAFKNYHRTSLQSVEGLVADIRRFTTYYCRMALRQEEDSQLKNAFQDIRELRVDVAYPLLLELYDDFDNKILNKEDFLTAVRLIESYVFRRAVCAIPTNSMNKTFATFAKSIKKDRYLESIQALFLLLPSYRRFPNDEEFKRELKLRNLYNFRSCSYWLRRLENHDRKERISVDEYTIEHIMPQNPNLSLEWQNSLGEEWQRIQETWLHTLGNLTLTGYNSEYGDKPFKEKRDIEGGFAQSPLHLNSGFGQVQVWNEDAIKNRANQLAKKAVEVWTGPSLDLSILNAYRPQAATSGYGIDDHPHLAGGSLRELFEAFRKEVLSLDPNVTEEFLKLYVAYKAETNFVDVVPQAKRLRFSLNIPFADIDDPKGICKDVSALGRWGNGDTEVGLASLEELPYIIGLVRQALERQLDNNGIE